MTENKGTMLAKSVQKHAGRAKEKILQNLGKVDRTADDIFDEHLNNFNRQQTNANRLQKEFNNYIRCIRAAQAASKSLMDAITEVYEPHWVGYDALQAQAGATESLWQDFAHKLADQVLIPLNTYTGQFPEMKKKVDKRNRKLIDYDGQRHSFQSLQANANKRKDDVKLTKGREQLEEARRTYEILNTELHDELPALYDSRILFLVTNLQTLFATEQVFHNETAKIYSELEAIVDKLATDSQRGSNTLRKQTSKFMESSSFSAPSPTKTSPFKQMNNTSPTTNSNYQNQITTNGSSNVNSPSSTSTSSSHQTSRLDSVSPTPESTPEILKASTAAAPTLSNASVGSPSSPENSPVAGPVAPPSYQHAAELLSTVTNVATPNNSNNSSEQRHSAVLDSPNANTANALGAPTEKNENTIVAHTEIAAATAAGAEASVTTDAVATTNKVESNVTAAAATSNSVDEGSSHTAKKGAKPTPEQLNGNSDDVNGSSSATQSTTINAANPTPPPATATTPTTTATDVNNGNADETSKKSGDATTSDLPAGVLYRVKATYGYVKEDVDELSFEVGDIIRVIEYDDPEDQEEGWLMGQKEVQRRKVYSLPTSHGRSRRPSGQAANNRRPVQRTNDQQSIKISEA